VTDFPFPTGKIRSLVEIAGGNGGNFGFGWVAALGSGGIRRRAGCVVVAAAPPGKDARRNGPMDAERSEAY
jgi:hypothetical protein